jgi:rod shape-determining protein MreD
MPPHNATAGLAVMASLLLAMVLRIVPLPKEWFVYNPDWVLLFLIYWAMAVPERVGVGYAWCVGVLVDALTGRMLGQHALAYTVVIFMCVKLHGRWRPYPPYLQAFSILLLLLAGQVLVFWTQNIKASSSAALAYWLPSLVGALLWPVVLPALHRIRRHYPNA